MILWIFERHFTLNYWYNMAVSLLDKWRGTLNSGAKRNALKRSGFERPFQARQSRLGMAS